MRAHERRDMTLTKAHVQRIINERQRSPAMLAASIHQWLRMERAYLAMRRRRNAPMRMSDDYFFLCVERCERAIADLRSLPKIDLP